MNSPAPITDDSIVKRSRDVVEAEIDGEVVALNIETGTCYGLNKVGSRIWQLISEPSRVADIGARLTAEYEVDEKTCRQQMLALLEELRREDLITLIDDLAGP